MLNSDILPMSNNADKRCLACYNRFLDAKWLPLSLIILCHCNYKLRKERTALALKRWEQGLFFIGTWKKLQLPPQPPLPLMVTLQPDAPLVCKYFCSCVWKQCSCVRLICYCLFYFATNSFCPSLVFCLLTRTLLTFIPVKVAVQTQLRTEQYSVPLSILQNSNNQIN